MHEMQPFRDINHHLLPLAPGDAGHRFLLFVKNFEEGSAVAEFGDNDWVALVHRGSHEQHQVRVADFRQSFNFSLEFEAELIVDDEALGFKFLYSDICVLVLSLVYYSCSSFTNFHWVGYLLQIYFLRLFDRMVNELYGKIPFFVINIWLPFTVFAFTLVLRFIFLSKFELFLLFLLLSR